MADDRQPQLLTAVCARCGDRIVSVPALNWMHAPGVGAITSLAVSCANGEFAAAPAPTTPILHARMTIADGRGLDDLIRATVPMPVPQKVLDRGTRLDGVFAALPALVVTAGLILGVLAWS